MIDDDVLWNPTQDSDSDVQRLEALLSPFGVRARGLKLRATWQPLRRIPLRRAVFGLAAVLAGCALLIGFGAYRLDWRSDKPWTVVTKHGDGRSALSALVPGSTLTTGRGETAMLAVARIGEVTLSSESRLKLVSTRAGRHRVRLEDGHLRARIWAPPDYFGVESGAAEVIDLGCDFDLWKHVDGSGRIYVRNGWVAYRVASQEVLVPSGFAMQFDAQNFLTPLRSNADPAFIDAVASLERVIANSGARSASAMQASRRVADLASDEDAYSLLSLLSRQPRLASGDLYPRLAKALSLSVVDPAHRRAWTEGSREAIDAWWTKLPVQPKRWLANWTDLFG